MHNKAQSRLRNYKLRLCCKGEVMGLKDLLGDSYKDGMTIEDIEKVLSDRKLADLSSGDYVSKGKYAELDKKYKDIVEWLNDNKGE